MTQHWHLAWRFFSSVVPRKLPNMSPARKSWQKPSKVDLPKFPFLRRTQMNCCRVIFWLEGWTQSILLFHLLVTNSCEWIAVVIGGKVRAFWKVFIMKSGWDDVREAVWDHLRRTNPDRPQLYSQCYVRCLGFYAKQPSHSTNTSF